MPVDIRAKRPVAVFTHSDFDHADEKCIVMLSAFDTRLFGLTLVSLFPDAFLKRSADDGIFFTTFVDRKEFGLAPGRPGDIDILVIPHTAGRPCFRDSIAIEAKVLRADFSKRSSSPNSFGISQAKGLLRDGFPRVGLLTIVVVPNPSGTPEQSLRPLELCQAVGSNGGVNWLGSVRVDTLGIDLAARHYGRLLAQVRPEELAIGVVHVDTKEVQLSLTDGTKIRSAKVHGHSIPEAHKGMRNPDSNPHLLRRIHSYFATQGDRFIAYPWKAPPSRGDQPRVRDTLIGSHSKGEWKPVGPN